MKFSVLLILIGMIAWAYFGTRAQNRQSQLAFKNRAKELFGYGWNYGERNEYPEEGLWLNAGFSSYIKHRNNGGATSEAARDRAFEAAWAAAPVHHTTQVYR